MMAIKNKRLYIIIITVSIFIVIFIITILLILFLDVRCDDSYPLLPNSKLRVERLKTDHYTAPYIVAIGVGSGKDFKLKCSGTIISLNWLLTTAKCIVDTCQSYDLKNVAIRSGSKSWNEKFVKHRVISYYQHKRYIQRSDFNFGTIQVWEPFVHVHEKVIRIADFEYELKINSEAVLSGWRRNTGNRELGYFTAIKQVDVTIISSGKDCNDLFTKHSGLYLFSDRIFCGRLETLNETECYPAGSPVIQNHILVGFVLFQDSCADDKKTGLVFIKVSKFVNWLIAVEIRFLRESINFLT